MTKTTGAKFMFQTAFALAQHQKQCVRRFGSGLKIIDTLIGGGFETSVSYLLYGSPHCTEILRRSITATLRQLPATNSVVVIDGNNGIRPDKILDDLKRNSALTPPSGYLDRLHVARAFTTNQLLTLLEDAPTILHETQTSILFVTGITHLLQEEEPALPPPHPHRRKAPLDPLVFRRAQLAIQLKQLAFTQQVAVIASADAPKHPTQAPLRIGQVAHHAFHVLIHHSQRDHIDTFTLEKHPSLPWQQLSAISGSAHRRKPVNIAFHSKQRQTTLLP